MEIAVCCICRNEKYYVKEWISFYKNIGFDSVYIYDNVSNDGTSEILSALDNIGEIKRVFWPRKDNIPPQRAAYSHFIDTYSKKYDFVLICDMDEFLLVPEYNAKKFLSDAIIKEPNLGAIAVPWLIFGSSGHREHHDDLVISRFTKCDDDISTIVKTILRPEKVQNMRTHICDLLNGLYLTGDLQLAKWHNTSPISVLNNNENGAVMHHYYTKSEDEWIERRKLPKADRAKIENKNTKEFALYSNQTRNNNNAKVLSPIIEAWISGLDLKLNTINESHDKIKIKICHVNSQWMFGVIEGFSNSLIEIKFCFSGEKEISIKTKLSKNGSTPFSLKLKWREVQTKEINALVIGSLKSYSITKEQLPNIESSFFDICKYFSASEEHILSTFLQTLTNNPSQKIIDTIDKVNFIKYPNHMEFIRETIKASQTGDMQSLTEFLGRNVDYSSKLESVKNNIISLQL